MDMFQDILRPIGRARCAGLPVARPSSQPRGPKMESSDHRRYLEAVGLTPARVHALGDEHPADQKVEGEKCAQPASSIGSDDSCARTRRGEP